MNMELEVDREAKNTLFGQWNGSEWVAWKMCMILDFSRNKDKKFYDLKLFICCPCQYTGKRMDGFDEPRLLLHFSVFFVILDSFDVENVVASNQDFSKVSCTSSVNVLFRVSQLSWKERLVKWHELLGMNNLPGGSCNRRRRRGIPCTPFPTLVSPTLAFQSDHSRRALGWWASLR